MAGPGKIRIDQYLVEKGLCESRNQAQVLIRAGEVLVNEVVVDRPGAIIKAGAVIRIRSVPKYVSRGGLKLEKALSEFHIDVTDKVCLDIGASTGGFSDCLLKHGARKVYAIDVGYGQMHWRLQTDPRVVRLDRENFRYFDVTRLAELIDICVVDVSFISLKLIIPKIVEVFTWRPRGGVEASQVFTRKDSGRGASDQGLATDSTRPPTARMICLIKPQFEAGPEHVDKGGIVRDEAARTRCVRSIAASAAEQGFVDISATPSPITGRDGNQEYLLVGRWARTS